MSWLLNKHGSKSEAGYGTWFYAKYNKKSSRQVGVRTLLWLWRCISVSHAMKMQQHIIYRHLDVIIIDFRFSQEQSESGIHFLNTSSVLQLLKHSKLSLLLCEVEHWVLHCIVQCRELRPYPEELDNNWFYPASAPVLSFHQHFSPSRRSSTHLFLDDC